MGQMVFYTDFIQLPEENTVIIYMTNELRYDTQIVVWEIEQLLFNKNYTPIIPKMKSVKHTTKDITGKHLEIIHQFVNMMLKENKSIDDFVEKHLANKKSTNRYKMWFRDM